MWVLEKIIKKNRQLIAPFNNHARAPEICELMTRGKGSSVGAPNRKY